MKNMNLKSRNNIYINTFNYKFFLLLKIIIITTVFKSFTQNTNPVFKEIILPKNIRTINSIEIENDSLVWVGTNKGLLKIKNDKITRFYDKSNPLKYAINSITIDNDGVKWLGTYNSSIIKFVNKYNNFEISLSSITNDELEIITSITNVRYTESGNQIICAGTPSGKIIIYEITSNNIYTIKSPTRNIIYKILIEENGKKWICTSDGMFFSNKKKKWKKVHKVSKSYGIKSNGQFWAIGRDKKHKAVLMLLFKKGGFAIKKDKGVWKELSLDRLPDAHTRFYDFALAKDENIWLATETGLVLYNPFKGTYKIFNQDNSPNFKMKSVKHIAIQNDKILWIGSNGNKLYKVIVE